MTLYWFALKKGHHCSTAYCALHTPPRASSFICLWVIWEWWGMQLEKAKPKMQHNYEMKSCIALKEKLTQIYEGCWADIARRVASRELILFLVRLPLSAFLVRLPLSGWFPIWELTCQIVCLLDQRLLLPASHDRPGLFVGGMWCGHHRASIRVIALITRPPGPPTVWAMHSGQPNPSRQKKLSQEWVRV